MTALTLSVTRMESRDQWLWLLAEVEGGTPLADFEAHVDRFAPEYVAFSDLPRYLRQHTDPLDPFATEEAIVDRLGDWIAEHILGPLTRELVARAPVSVQVILPGDLDFLMYRPLELARIAGKPLVRHGVTLVFDIEGITPPRRQYETQNRLRILGVFTQPAEASALDLRQERYDLLQMIRQLAVRSRRSIDIEILQYGVTRQKLRDQALEGSGWDVLHISAHGTSDALLLEKSDGGSDLVSALELVEILRPAAGRLKLLVLSSCESGAASAAESLRWLRLDDAARRLEEQAEADARKGRSSSDDTILYGVARQLHSALGCAVLAMRYPVTDEFAIALNRHLYSLLFEHGQQLDRAFNLALNVTAGVSYRPGIPARSLATPFLLGSNAMDLQLRPPIEAVALPALDRTRMSEFPDEPIRFVGRNGQMAQASSALASRSRRTAVLFHGMAGAGKTACAVELAYRHQKSFEAVAYWTGPRLPEQASWALADLAISLENQLGGLGLALVDTTDDISSFERQLRHLTEFLEQSGVLILLDNLDVLLDDQGTWREKRWQMLIEALLRHHGESRVVLTCRRRPGGLPATDIAVLPVHALSLAESALLARQLPNLGYLLGTHGERGPRDLVADRDLVRRTLRAVQGHPKLLEIADAIAVSRDALASRIEATEAAPLDARAAAFFSSGESAYDDIQFWNMLLEWTLDVARTLSAPNRLMLEMVCCLEDTDRSSVVIRDIWENLQPDGARTIDRGSFEEALQLLIDAALVGLEAEAEVDGELVSTFSVHPAVAEVIRAQTAPTTREAVDQEVADCWLSTQHYALEGKPLEYGPLVVHAGLAAAPYLIRLREWDEARLAVERALHRDESPATKQISMAYLQRIWDESGDYRVAWVLGSQLASIRAQEAERLLREALRIALDRKDHATAAGVTKTLAIHFMRRGGLEEALEWIGDAKNHTSIAGLGPWTQLSDEATRLQIENERGEYQRVLANVEKLDNELSRMPRELAEDERVEFWATREVLFNVGLRASQGLNRWDSALDFGIRIMESMTRRSASQHDVARARYNLYPILVKLQRIPEAELILEECQELFAALEDIEGLAWVLELRAGHAQDRRDPDEAIDLFHRALRYGYVAGEPGFVARCHFALAGTLIYFGYEPTSCLANRLASLLINGARDRDNASHIEALASDLMVAGEARMFSDASQLYFEIESIPGVHLEALLRTLGVNSEGVNRILTESVRQAASLHADANVALKREEPLIAGIVAASKGNEGVGDCVEVYLDDLRDDDAEWNMMLGLLRDVSTGRARPGQLIGENAFAHAIFRRTLDAIEGSVALEATVQEFLVEVAGGYDSVIAAVVAVASGRSVNRALLEATLSERSEMKVWAPLVPALRRIMAGERETSLVERLPPFGSAVLSRTLGALSGRLSLNASSDELTIPAKAAEHWEPIIAGIAAAVSGDRVARSAVVDYLDWYETNVEWSVPLVTTLRKVLIGQRDDLNMGLGPFDLYVVDRTLAALAGEIQLSATSEDLLLSAADLARWDPVIAAVLAAVAGDVRAAAALDVFLGLWESTDEGSNLGSILRKIIAGSHEIDPNAILNPQELAICRRVIDALAGTITPDVSADEFLSRYAFWNQEALMAAVVVAAQGDADAAKSVESALDFLAIHTDRAAFVRVLHLIIAGERDGRILEGLVGFDRGLARRALGALNGELSLAASVEDFLAQTASPPQWEEEIAAVVAAAQGDGFAAEMIESYLVLLEDHPGWLRRLGTALRKVIAGNRDEGVLRGLDPPSCAVVRRVLGALQGNVELNATLSTFLTKRNEKTVEANQPLLLAIANAALSNGVTNVEITSLLEELAPDPDWAPLAERFASIIRGERSEELTQGLSSFHAAMVDKTLQIIESQMGGKNTLRGST